jgi:thioredoxin-related protein
MRNVLVLGMMLFLGLSYAQNTIVNWVSLDEAIQLQKKNPKKILIDMYTVWCGPCKMLDKNTFQNADVASYINEHYYAVKFNAEGNEEITFKDRTFANPNYDPAKAARRNYPHELTRYFGVRAYPTVVFLDENLEFLAPIKGYKNPQQLELYLKLFKNDDHKRLTTQEAFNEYYETFKPEFKTEK